MKRMIGIDIFRILSALIVFLFHANINFGCKFGMLNSFISMGAIFMSAFFMISGFSVYYVYSNQNLMLLENTKKFYIKRFIGIFPLYYVTTLLYDVFISISPTSVNMILAPIRIWGGQAVFHSIFGVGHNGGTWFISCLVICYLLYPFFQEMLKQMSCKNKLFFGGHIDFAICSFYSKSISDTKYI